MSATWANLGWGPWISFADNEAWKTLPTTAGLYRVRATTRDELFYIGETGRNLRERIGALRTNSQKKTMPFNDPHTAAPALWAWHDSDQLDYECSAMALHDIEYTQDPTRTLRGLKCYLLWRYRLERGGQCYAIMAISLHGIRNQEIGATDTEGNVSPMMPRIIPPAVLVIPRSNSLETPLTKKNR